MKHIRQINSINTNTYTVVNSDGYGGDGQPSLDQHPSILEHPELFEVVDIEIPESYQLLEYES